MKKLSSKKKIIIAIASLGVFVIAGIISLVLVLAAGQQNVQSNINVTYVSRNVAAQVTAKYWYTGSSKTTMGTTENFGASEQTRTATMSPSGNIELTTENNKVFFEYAFKNLSKDTAFTVDLTNSPKITANGAQTVNFTNMNEQYYVSAAEIPVETLGSIALSNTLNVQPIMGQREGQNDTVYIYVVASIDNLSNNAAYNGTFAWELNHINTTNNPIVTINLDNNSGTPASSSMQVVTGTYGASNKTINMPCVFTVPTKSGKGFTGYYSASSAGTAYISFNGSPVHSNKTTAPADMTASTTLYAQWSDFVVGAQGTLTSVGAGTLVTDGDDKIITIPDYVTTIDSNAFTAVASDVTIINVPTSVTTISDYAFAGLSDLVEINFNYNASSASGNLTYTGENNLTSIGEYAFQNCTSLTELEIPESVTTFSAYMFDGCTNLHYLTAPIYKSYDNSNYVSYHYLDGLTNLHLTINGDGVELDSYAFCSCTNLVSITLPESLTSIGVYAFKECTSLSSITLPAGLISIGGNTFYKCTALTSVAVPSSVTTIGERAFYKCGNLTTLTFGSGLRTIGSKAFYECSNLSSVTIPTGLTSIGEYAFQNCTSLTGLVIPGSVTTFSAYMFSGCTNLHYLTAPIYKNCNSQGSSYHYLDGLTNLHLTVNGNDDEIKFKGFRQCTNLVSITIPSSVTSINGSAFFECTNLVSVTLSSGLTSIGQSAFEECTKLSSITLPSSLTSIGMYAFYNCDALKNVTIPSGVTSIGSEAFYSSGITSISIPSSVTSIGNKAFASCDDLKDVYYNATMGDAGLGSEPYLFAYSGYNVNGDRGMDVVIGKDVTRIPNNLFQANLEKVKPVFINSLTFETGSSLASLGESCFNLVFFNSYDPIVFPETLLNINDKAFRASTVKNVVMKGVTTIGAEAFYNCEHLESVTIRDVTSISTSKAFKYCYNLFEIYQLGTGITLTAQNSLDYTGSSANGYISTRAKVINTSESTPSNYVNYNGVRYYNDNGDYIATGALNVKATSVTISHSSCTKINNFAFEYCDYLSSVTITSPVTHIGEEAFSHTALDSFTVPSTVTSISKLVFAGRSSITVTFAASGTWTIKYQDGTTVNSSYTPAASTYRTYFTTEDEDHGGYYWIKN